MFQLGYVNFLALGLSNYCVNERIVCVKTATKNVIVSQPYSWQLRIEGWNDNNDCMGLTPEHRN